MLANYCELFICRRYILRSHEITFSQITPANGNGLKTRFYRKTSSHVACTLLCKLHNHRHVYLLNNNTRTIKNGNAGKIAAENISIFCHHNNKSLHLFPGGQFPWNLNTKHVSLLSRVGATALKVGTNSASEARRKFSWPPIFWPVGRQNIA